MHSELVETRDGEQRLEAKLFVDEGAAGPRPGVLVCHTWAGRGEFECGRAEALAGLGYVGFAVDLFGDGRVGASPEENRARMQALLDDRDLLLRRLRLNLDAMAGHAAVDASRMAAVGYCFGGLCVLDLARSGAADVRGVVSFHGLVDPPGDAPVGGIGASVLVLNGALDPWVPPEKLRALEEELTEAGADWQVHQYGGAMHAFTNPSAASPDSGAQYDPRTAERAWRTMRGFLEDCLAP